LKLTRAQKKFAALFVIPVYQIPVFVVMTFTNEMAGVDIAMGRE